MKRRSMLAAIGTAAVAGCLSSADPDDSDSPLMSTSDQSVLGDVPDDQIYALEENAEYEVVLIHALTLKSRNSVRYTNHDDAEVQTWDPGEDRNIVVADFSVENLSDNKLEYPSWEQFELVTPEDTIGPVIETPDGTSVDEIRKPYVSWPESSGLRASYRRGWSAVYNAPAYATENYALRWTYPEDPIYWRSD